MNGDVVALDNLVGALRSLALNYRSFVPSSHNLAGAAGVAVALALYAALGLTARKESCPPEIRLLAGWGLACLVLTFWGVATSIPLRWPLAGLVILGAVLSLRSGLSLEPPAGAGRILALTAPLWLVVLPMFPSQYDTWGNLLPNAAYLFDHEFLPTEARPPSYSALPVAPYNTQFTAYIASFVTGDFADASMGLFHIALQCAMALLLARVLTHGTAVSTASVPAWWACAASLLLTIPLNPGHEPRIFFSAYGEAPAAVATAFAAWLAATVLRDLADGVPRPSALVPLGLVLAALVNIKQSTIGQFVALGVAMLLVALAHPRIPRRRGIALISAALLPAGALYLVWRWFAVAGFPVGELKLMAVADWNFHLLPQILRSVLLAMLSQFLYASLTLALLIAAAWKLRRDPWSFDGLLLGVISGTILGVTAFLVLTYVAHFDPVEAAKAHSFPRYASQLSLVIMLGVVVIARPLIVGWVAGVSRSWLARWRSGLVLICLALPVGLVVLVRFDLRTPQPEIRTLAANIAAHLRPGDKVALLLPGDNFDSVGMMLRGLLLFSPPRRLGLDFRTETSANPATLSAVAAAGYQFAFISCTPPNLEGIPQRVAALLRRAPDGWRTLDSWPYPADLSNRYFAGGMARRPFCAELPPETGT